MKLFGVPSKIRKFDPPVYRLTVHTEKAVVYVSGNTIPVVVPPDMYDNALLDPVVPAASTAIVGTGPEIAAAFVEFTFEVHFPVAVFNVDTSYHAASPVIGLAVLTVGGHGGSGGCGGENPVIKSFVLHRYEVPEAYMYGLTLPSLNDNAFAVASTVAHKARPRNPLAL